MNRDGAGARARRTLRVVGRAGGLAARLAGARYLGVAIDRREHARELRAALGGLKGPLMKVAQLLAAIPEALPREYAAELSQLQANAPAMGWLFVRRRMAGELGAGWERRFAGFEREAARAASLGQVHRARSRGGVALACKLQYPDMAAAVEADLAQLKLVFAAWRRIDGAIDPGAIHAELAERLREELDYGREARHAALYAAMLRDEPGVRVPTVHSDLSTRRLLTMTWLDGAPLDSLADAPVGRRNDVARNLFRAWYAPFYDYGVIHGDPHPGNYTVRADGAVNLLDYGCVRFFDGGFVRGVVDLYRALRTGDEALAVSAYEGWGFTDLRRETIDVLNLWAAYVYAPLLEDRERPIQDGGADGYGGAVAARVHRELRRIGGVRPPRAFVLVDRAAVGLGSVFLKLRAEINWRRLFEETIAGFDADALAARQAAARRAVGLGDSPAGAPPESARTDAD